MLHLPNWTMPHLSSRNYILLGSSLLLAATVALASIGLNRSDPVTLPNETAIHVTLNQTVASDRNRPGDHFAATVAEPIIVADKTVIPKGAPVEGLAVIGGPVGAGVGTAAALLTGRKDIRLSPETPLTFTLVEPVTINAKG